MPQPTTSQRSTAAPETFDETRGERWARRAITGPALVAMTPAYLALSPALLATAALTDLVHHRPMTRTRFVAAVGGSLGLHLFGLASVAAAWLAGGRWAGVDPERERRLEQELQVQVAKAAWWASEHLYRMRMVVEGDACVEPGPVLLLSRHASLLDTLLPLVLLAARHGLRLRYVAKRELLWDPFIDALGHRWPTAFVRRGTAEPREVAHVVGLLDHLGARDAIALFPEGSRFSAEKRARILASLERAHPEAHAACARLQHVLPPHPRAVLALLAAAPALDVVVCAHTGLEGASHFTDLIDGCLLDRTVHVQLRRIRRTEIPAGHDAQVAWLNDQWRQVDAWIDRNRP
jgi:1-acyl-sn-glycerol-3-phosphate acyltransferase